MRCSIEWQRYVYDRFFVIVESLAEGFHSCSSVQDLEIYWGYVCVMFIIPLMTIGLLVRHDTAAAVTAM